MSAPRLSALIIAKDEERDLPACLESLSGAADEIVVLVDASTSDRTEELARAAGCRVARRVFDDYARQRQAALDLCAGDWVLWIDADERLSPALKRALAGPLPEQAAGFILPFHVRFLGRTLRFGGLGGETHLRLFRRSRGRFVGGALHEGVELQGPCARFPLEGTIEHEPYRDIPDYMSKLDRYTTLAAEKRFAAGRRFAAWDHLRPLWELFSRLVLRLGILDGRPGLFWAYLAAFHTWLKYAKLADMERSR